MNPKLEEFQAAYAAGLRSYVADRTETNLRLAYELGRDAVVRDLNVLDLTLVHHEALLGALVGAERAEVEPVTRAAAAFVLESVSAFEMVRRGFSEAQEAALLERRHSAMLRQLSNFLADASLALTTSDSLKEMLQLVAEQARELVGADWCRVTLNVRYEPQEALASETEATTTGASDTRQDRSRRATFGSAGTTAQHLTELPKPAARAPGSDTRLPRRGSLAAPLQALDGREIGSIEVAFNGHRTVTELDEAILANLAQMLSAAVERTWRYRPDA